MVTTIDPVVHGGRNRRYATAVFLHIVGATASAAALGGVLGAIGAIGGGPWAGGPALIAVIAGLYALREMLGLPIPIPDRRRQVPEWWRTFYSPPVASLLYGVGLGIGFLTFLGYGTFVAASVAAIATGSPAVGALVCGSFGLARGLAVMVAAPRGGDAALDAVAHLGGTRWPSFVNQTALLLLVASAFLH
jgi:hypothetical protein